MLLRLRRRTRVRRTLPRLRRHLTRLALGAALVGTALIWSVLIAPVRIVTRRRKGPEPVIIAPVSVGVGVAALVR